MSVLNVVGLKKLLGAQEVLRGIDLRLEAGEKVGVVGRNGEGKTTLLRCIEGEETPDAGTVQLTRGMRLGYVQQRPQFPAATSVRAWVEGGLEEVHRVEAELHRVGDEMAEAAGERLESLVKRHGELTARMEFLEGWEAERRVEKVLAGIGLDPALWDREARTLSGGEKSRTAMARELVSVPDLLLLDEPTNHLDLAGIEWLEGYLGVIHSAVLMVSHDRRLLDRVSSSIVELERGLAVRYPGNYSRYVDLKHERFLSAYRAWELQHDQIKKEEAFIRKHMGSQRTAEAKGRRKRLQNVERVDRPYDDVRRPTIALPATERGGELVLHASELAVGHGGKPLLRDVDVRLGRGERVGVVGPNGSGKTTLLRALAGLTQPLAGTIQRGYRAACGYYDQEIADLRSDGTPFTEIRRDHPTKTDEEIRSHLALFLFRGSDVDLAVSGLSGGERARLALAKLVLTEPSWLALDEPTNHLDLPSRTALEETLGRFSGALVIVSHDRELLDRLTNRTIEVRDGRVRDFAGNYSAYRAQVLAEEAERAGSATRARERQAKDEKARAAAAQARSAPRASPGKPPAAAAKPPVDGAKRSDGAQRGARKKPRNPWRLEKVETAIIALEEERARLMEALASETVYRDPEAVKETQYRLAELERELHEKNLEWESLI